MEVSRPPHGDGLDLSGLDLSSPRVSPKVRATWLQRWRSAAGTPAGRSREIFGLVRLEAEGPCPTSNLNLNPDTQVAWGRQEQDKD